MDNNIYCTCYELMYDICWLYWHICSGWCFNIFISMCLRKSHELPWFYDFTTCYPKQLTVSPSSLHSWVDDVPFSNVGYFSSLEGTTSTLVVSMTFWWWDILVSWGDQNCFLVLQLSQDQTLDIMTYDHKSLENTFQRGDPQKHGKQNEVKWPDIPPHKNTRDIARGKLTPYFFPKSSRGVLFKKMDGKQLQVTAFLGEITRKGWRFDRFFAVYIMCGCCREWQIWRACFRNETSYVVSRFLTKLLLNYHWTIHKTICVYIAQYLTKYFFVSISFPQL